MLNCKQATALMSQRMDKELGLWQKIGLQMHLMMCSGCRNFRTQMEFLRQSCQKFTQKESK
jgi:predicted anti-sigma-YlaC factor YlaD